MLTLLLFTRALFQVRHLATPLAALLQSPRELSAKPQVLRLRSLDHIPLFLTVTMAHPLQPSLFRLVLLVLSGPSLFRHPLRPLLDLTQP
ncbi:hypothetical protein B0I35DRAFT_433753 [Stachybotrys elegans]|uniref:Secreted protein n=1 Tax=Stachybotrys elegans TaxID=80388 RepID=A0A8K0WRK4_9HYPO|nr:hypothetical protein B0I35DRAFT_433753 [Stachybotrys elegans]